MKRFLFILFISIQAFAQNKYVTKTGNVNFEASVPSFEEVSAKNNSVTAIVNTENGEFAALALVKAFRFKNALMEEHFNENYAESDTYAKASFKGSIKDFFLEKLSFSKTSHNIIGQLTFHGTTKEINCKALISKIENSLVIEGNFKVLASDFNIEIPKIVKNKIAEDVQVTFQFTLVNK